MICTVPQSCAPDRLMSCESNTLLRPWQVPRQGKVHIRQGGFTLIEMMVVIAIIGILAALIAPKIMSRPDEARAVAARQDIATLMQALNLYRLDNARYPTATQGLAALVKCPTVSPVPNNCKADGYLERLPKDPWGAQYQYANPGQHGEIDVFSYGKDGKPEGNQPLHAIGSWQ